MPQRPMLPTLEFVFSASRMRSSLPGGPVRLPAVRRLHHMGTMHEMPTLSSPVQERERENSKGVNPNFTSNFLSRGSLPGGLVRLSTAVGRLHTSLGVVLVASTRGQRKRKVRDRIPSMPCASYSSCVKHTANTRETDPHFGFLSNSQGGTL